MVGGKHWVKIVRRHTPVASSAGVVTYTKTTEPAWGRLGPLRASEAVRLGGRSQDDVAMLKLPRGQVIDHGDQVIVAHESAPLMFQGEWDVVAVSISLGRPKATLARRWPSG